MGALEILVMMPTVLDRFSARKDDAIKSFVYPLLLYPFVLWSFSVVHQTRDPIAYLLHALTAWGGVFVFFSVIYYVTKQQGKKDCFWQFVNMANTQSILSFFLLIPIFLMTWNHVTEGEFFKHYWVFFILTDMVFTGFVITKSLRLNAYLGAFFATIGLFFADVGGQLVRLYLDSGQVG